MGYKSTSKVFYLSRARLHILKAYLSYSRVHILGFSPSNRIIFLIGHIFVVRFATLFLSFSFCVPILVPWSMDMDELWLQQESSFCHSVCYRSAHKTGQQDHMTSPHSVVFLRSFFKSQVYERKPQL